MTIDQIVEQLSRFHQRATYGAVAGMLAQTPRSVMQGRQRNWINSWVVNQESGLPSEYPAPLVHPAIEERPVVLETPEQLRQWLRAPE